MTDRPADSSVILSAAKDLRGGPLHLALQIDGESPGLS
jgi:hypothetical protein